MEGGSDILASEQAEKTPRCGNHIYFSLCVGIGKYLELRLLKRTQTH